MRRYVAGRRRGRDTEPRLGQAARVWRSGRRARTVRAVLTAFDDFPVHQTSRPIAHTATADLNHYDRYFFNGYRRDGSLFFGVALGLYPNRGIIDAAFSVIRDGEQVSVHASGRLPDGRPSAVGPVRVEVVEPLRVLRVLVDAPEEGLRASLRFTGRGVAVEEPPFLLQRGTSVAFDYTRLTQLGAWEGWVEVDGVRTALTPTVDLGSRDRSWGVRPVGRGPEIAPAGFPQFFWLWAPLCFESVGTLFDVQEHGDGRRWHEGGSIVPADGSAPVTIDHVDHRITWEPGTRRALAAELDLHEHRGPTHTIELEPILHFQMLGIGYLHPSWGHGAWKGDEAVGAERWPLPVPDPLALHHVHVQTLVRATLDGEHEGIGVLEQLVIGPHEPSGFTGALDGAA
jgi:hypothetical protein